MSYELGFLDDALSEWRKLDGTVRAQFKKKFGHDYARLYSLASQASQQLLASARTRAI